MDMRIKVSLMCVLSIFIVSCATTQGTSVGKSDDSGMVVLKGDDTFKNAAAGFSIKKPEGWVYLSADDMEESRNSVKFNDEEFAEYVKARANMPLVVIAKYTEPYEDLNPSIQVVIRPVGGSSEQDVEVVKLLGYVNNVLKGTFDNFKVIEKPEGVKVSGIKSRRFGRFFMTYPLNSSTPYLHRLFKMNISSPS